eukprot:TRINITY_DN164_c0_g1_i1.p1 TRINITY_DN164_c0_g1~~TRINITY_DN164_c0_g1_i1.p1  ORF type:complete len:1007 (-),score=338.12 TRINITY_DN164_c0_g1_i1:214-3234(-)
MYASMNHTVYAKFIDSNFFLFVWFIDAYIFQERVDFSVVVVSMSRYRPSRPRHPPPASSSLSMSDLGGYGAGGSAGAAAERRPLASPIRGYSSSIRRSPIRLRPTGGAGHAGARSSPSPVKSLSSDLTRAALSEGRSKSRSAASRGRLRGGDPGIVQHRQELQIQLLQDKCLSAKEEASHAREDFQKALERAREAESEQLRLIEISRDEKEHLQQQLVEVQKKCTSLQHQLLTKEEEHGREIRDERLKSRELDRQVRELQSSLQSLQEINKNQSEIIENQRISHEEEQMRTRDSYELRCEEERKMRENMEARIASMTSCFHKHVPKLTGWIGERETSFVEVSAALAKQETLIRRSLERMEKEEAKQMAWAAEYREQTNRIMDDMLHRLQGSLSEMRHLETKFGTVDDDLKDARRTLHRVEKERDHLRERIHSVENELSLTQQKYTDTVAQLRTDVQHLQHDMEVNDRDSSHERERLLKDLTSYRALSEELEGKVATLETDKRAVEEDNARNIDSIRELTVRCKDAEHALEVEKASHARDVDRLQVELDDERNAFKTEITSEKQRVEHLQKDIVQLRDENEKLISEGKRFEKKIGDSEDRHTSEMDELEERCVTLEEELEVQRDMYNDEISGLRALLEQKQREVRDLVDEVEELRRQFEQSTRQIDEVRRKADGMQIALQASEADKGTAQKRIGLLESELGDMRELVEQLRGENETNSSRLKTSEAAREKQRAELEGKVSRLDAELARAREEVQQQRELVGVVQTHRMALQKEIDDVKGENAQLRQNSKEEIEALRSDATRAKSEAQALRDECDELRGRIRELEEELGILEEDRDVAIKRAEIIESEASSHRISADGEVGRLQSSYDELVSQLEVCKREIGTHREENERLRNRIAALEGEIRQMREVNEEAQHLKRENEELISQNRQCNDHMRELNAEIETLKRENVRLLKTVGDRDSEKERIQAAHERSLKELRDVNAQLAAQVRQAQAMLVLQRDAAATPKSSRR